MVNKVTPDTMLSASRLPAVMGLSKYRSPNDELQYSIRAIMGEERENLGNEAMEWGNQLEPIILTEAAKRLELADLQLEHTAAFYHPTLPLACSLDGYADGRGQRIRTDYEAGIIVVGQEDIELAGYGVMEAKLTAVAPEEMPALYRGPIQLQAQMDIMSAKWGALCVLYQGTALRVFLFAPHQQTINTISQVTTEFQAKLDKFRETGEIDYYPPANSKDADRMFPDASAETVALPDEAERLASEVIAAKAAIEEAEQRRSAAEADLKMLLGNATKGTVGKFQISWPMRSYKAQPEKIIPPKEAYSIRQSTLSIKEL